MKSLKIGKKLVVTFGVIILLFSLTVVASVLSLVTIGNSFTEFYITRSLTRPIKEIEAAANEMAEGQLKVDVQFVSKDELESLQTPCGKCPQGLPITWERSQA